MAKVYTVIGGVNRAGKSSLTGVLKNERDDLGMIIEHSEMKQEEATAASFRHIYAQVFHH